ncbi:helix-turn-helix transcriptional regulator [Acinetobacter qingfengensis]|uniref:AraC family transcriptional regulator n=1 Tax=Acinetobacter qingfengensis TaxID=1262585 RepID=A0A1E7R0B3_9GAMM|nr:helix-turn-helix transcriptional regulator [Acinetobacter qingfengensis]KAA8735401.1 helix-turn-helix transcriptional regulator [Acinetobacter qingfengensis]OEY92757.1 AraC family transcriptional regulator [Acinetobacter qingfengensis]
MRNIQIKDYENIPRSVMATGNSYSDGTTLQRHSHLRCQCLYAITGVLTVTTNKGSWVVPPRRALWIPSSIEHEVYMNGYTQTRSVYIQTNIAIATGLSSNCIVINVSSLLHELLCAAVDLPLEYTLGGRDDYLMQLIIAEIARMPELPLNTPLPQEPRLIQLCQQLLQTPSMEMDLDCIAKKVGMSRRNFTRLFRIQTGMSFGHWRQQACMLAALNRMELGQPITNIAMELGYTSSSAFTAAFRRLLGAPPTVYLQKK